MTSYTALEAATQGEIPPAYEQPWAEFDGVGLDLTDFTGQAKWKVNGGTQVVRSVIVSGSQTVLTWAAGDHDTPGLLAGEVIVSGGGKVYKRTFVRVIKPARGGA